jgi:hypothetical protein
MLVAGGAEEEERRVDGTTGDDDYIGAIGLALAVAVDDDAGHRATVRVRLEADDL